MMILLVFLGAVGLGVAAAEQQAAAPQLLKIAAGPAGNESSGVIPLFGGACQVQSFDGSRSDRVLPGKVFRGPGRSVQFRDHRRRDRVVVTRRPLTQAELFDRLNRMFVVFHRTNAAGRELDAAAGFSGSRGQVYTAMAAVDDVDNIRAVMSDGSTHSVTALLGWHRRGQWAVASALTSGSGEGIAIAPDSATAVGDRCFSMERGEPWRLVCAPIGTASPRRPSRGAIG